MPLFHLGDEVLCIFGSRHYPVWEVTDRLLPPWCRLLRLSSCCELVMLYDVVAVRFGRGRFGCHFHFVLVDFPGGDRRKVETRGKRRGKSREAASPASLLAKKREVILVESVGIVLCQR